MTTIARPRGIHEGQSGLTAHIETFPAIPEIETTICRVRLARTGGRDELVLG